MSGYSLGCWSAVVPFAKLRVGANDAHMGLLILCMGLGSLLLMPITGLVASRHGGRPVIVGSGIVIAIILPVLALAHTQVELAGGLFVLGAALGSLDVAMNAHAVEVEQAAHRPLMSGFHACFSIGAFAGSGVATSLFSLGVVPVIVLACCAGVIFALLAVILPRLLSVRVTQLEERWSWPKGIVLLLTVLASIAYLIEGAIFDWGALLVTGRHLVAVTHGGMAFMLFSIGMTGGRLAGDEVGLRLGRENVLQGGGALAALGLTLVLASPSAPLALAGFLLVGLGMSNSVPILFSQAGRQRVMPSGMAIAAITTVSYGVTLAGPGAVGLLASAIGLVSAFWVFVGLMLLAVAGSRFALR